MKRAAGAGRYLPLKHRDEVERELPLRVQPCIIYQVPGRVRKLNRKAYIPEVVSLGPFHHGKKDLLPMEEHKVRAVRHLLRRAGKEFEEFVAGMSEVAPQLERAYEGLHDNWSRPRLLQMLVTDGCFVLELMRIATRGRREIQEYAPDDPLFSRHGILYMVPYIRSDMLLIENQLPLLVLHKLVEIETGKSMLENSIKIMVLRFLSPKSKVPTSAAPGLHPLNVFRSSLLSSPPAYQYLDLRGGQHQGDHETTNNIITIHSATDLYNAGIRFSVSKTESLRDISFRRGVLSLPKRDIQDSTERMLQNLMAFEQLHVGAGNDVTAYVFFMNTIVNSAVDVALLRSKGIIHNALGSDDAVVRLLGRISRKVVLDPDSTLDHVHRQLNVYCRNHVRATLYTWWANLINTYFRNPWTFLSLTAATLLLVFGITQTVYAILPYYRRMA
ncbi:unnamed protein product [Urochloa decumbens]|uniref:Uncharacterized protein n=1 Tax=Urochloa decumbens TaxID=240449 RepID=A0ABC9B1R2_9POAL